MVLAGMGWDYHSRTGSVEVSLDIPALERLLAQHRSARVAGSPVEDRQALSAIAVSKVDCLESGEQAYVCHCVVEVVSKDGELVAGSCGWRCGVEASKSDPLMQLSSLLTKMVIPCVSMDEVDSDKLPASGR
jgi:hypothetical protein